MYKQITDEQIQIEAKSGYKPMVIESGITSLPLSDLGDREFELLAYLLVKKEISNSKHPNITDISLMQGVSERGRDCVLYNHGNVAGLIQCKKYRSRLTKPQVIKEILKFLLFATLDKSLLPDPENFEYKLYASNDFTEPAIKLIYSFNSEIEEDISTGIIEKYVDELIEEYESFSCYLTNKPYGEINKLLKSITVTSANISDLSARIYSDYKILSVFFNIKTVVDLESADNIIRSALDDYGVKYLTDEDLKRIQERIGSSKKENRVNLGLVDFFGFNHEFFRFLSGEPFKEIITAVANIKQLTEKYLLKFITAKTHEKIQTEITHKLLRKGTIHRFSIGIAAPYLVHRLSAITVKNSGPESIIKECFPYLEMSPEELISNIAEDLFNTSERVMKKDYSELVGDKNLVALKIDLYRHMHTGLRNIDDARRVFARDIKVIRPVLDKIELEIKEALDNDRTILIKDISFFDKADEMKSFVSSIKAIDS